MTIRIRPEILLLVILAAALPHPDQGVAAGQREKVPMTIAERERLLAGMRTYLESVEKITVALAGRHIEEIPKNARRSGKAMLATVEPATALTMPVGFTILSLDTHEKFDALADKAAAKAPRSELLADLGALLANCTGCHATYRIVTAKRP